MYAWLRQTQDFLINPILVDTLGQGIQFEPIRLHQWWQLTNHRPCSCHLSHLCLPQEHGLWSNLIFMPTSTIQHPGTRMQRWIDRQQSYSTKQSSNKQWKCFHPTLKLRNARNFSCIISTCDKGFTHYII